MKYLCLLLGLCVFLTGAVAAQHSSGYETLVQKGNAQLQAGDADLALASGEQAIKTNAERWEAYALSGGALMNLKRYEEAVDDLSKAIERAPEEKQPALRDLRKECLLAEAGASPAPTAPASTGTTTQAEIVLWKSIENSTNPADFQGYLARYPHGTFAVFAKQHLADLNTRLEKAQEQAAAQAEQKRLNDVAEKTWTDPNTGLMWPKDEFLDPPKVKGHHAKGIALANEYCAELRLLGYTAWRLPTATELLQIYHPPEQRLRHTSPLLSASLVRSATAPSGLR